MQKAIADLTEISLQDHNNILFRATLQLALGNLPQFENVT